MTSVKIGNAFAIEGYYDPDSDNPEVVRYRELPGERTTSFMMPDGLSLDEMTRTVIVTMECHMRSGTQPAWVESDHAALASALCLHWGIDPKKQAKPAEWGSNLGPAEQKPARARSSTKKATTKITSAAAKTPAPEAADEENN